MQLLYFQNYLLLLYFQNNSPERKPVPLSAFSGKILFRSLADNLERQRQFSLADNGVGGIVYYCERTRSRLNDETTGEEHHHAAACYGSVGCCGESTVEEGAKIAGSVSDLQQSAKDYESIAMLQV
ncbi:uncharacterized protein LOC108868568 isoform X2 [Pyrus x bretschneideri]|nr:uncharacterized protein LOC108868568 isoform X2 [Pyrus x bretschneideri]